jgi:hypothetical protein
MVSQPRVLAFQVFSTSFVFTAFSQSFHGLLTASPRKMVFIKHTQRLISIADKTKKRLIMKKTTPAIIFTILITTFLIAAMLLIGQNALNALPASAAAAAMML